MCQVTIRVTESGVDFKGGRLPKCVYWRVRALCDSLIKDSDAICHKEGRRLRRRKNSVRFSLPRGYRLIVNVENQRCGPYFCCSHSRYDKVIQQV